MKKKTIVKGLTAAAFLALSLSLAGCGKAEEKQMVLFTWQGMFPQEVLDGFTY